MAWNGWRGVPTELVQRLVDIWEDHRARLGLSAGDEVLSARRATCLRLRLANPDEPIMTRLRA